MQVPGFNEVTFAPLTEQMSGVNDTAVSSMLLSLGSTWTFEYVAALIASSLVRIVAKDFCSVTLVTIFGINLAISLVVPSTEIVARPSCEVPEVVWDTFTEVGSIVVVAVEVSAVLVEITVEVSEGVLRTV